jgi:arylamine N-acetyltransferase
MSDLKKNDTTKQSRYQRNPEYKEEMKKKQREKYSECEEFRAQHLNKCRNNYTMKREQIKRFQEMEEELKRYKEMEEGLKLYDSIKDELKNFMKLKETLKQVISV